MTSAAWPLWCKKFPGSVALSDLVTPFRFGVIAFIDALRAAGASVSVGATYRPPERAYLMHFACLVAGYTDKDKVFHQIAPSAVKPMAGVDIDWTCGGDIAEARAACAAMVAGYQIKYPAALVSRHTQRRAIDMTVKWQGSISVLTKRGNNLPAAAQKDLIPIGATYGVMKLASDPPHWSDDGR